MLKTFSMRGPADPCIFWPSAVAGIAGSISVTLVAKGTVQRVWCIIPCILIRFAAQGILFLPRAVAPLSMAGGISG